MSVVGWLLNLIYLALLTVLSPVLLYRAIRYGKYRAGWSEKWLGRVYPRQSDAVCAWLHAVSVGEVLLLRTIIDELRGRQPDLQIWISTTTHTGHAVARDKYGDCRVSYFPLDFTWAVKEALRRVRPDVIGLVELELWPNLIREAAKQNIPVVLVNGRMSDRSFRGYRRIRWFLRPTLRRFARLGVQTPEYRRRLMHLGACGQRTVVTGSVKFDGLALSRDNPRTADLKRAFGISSGQRVFVAGSTHGDEEKAVLDAFAALRKEFPKLRLILAPRHQERFREVARLIQSKRFELLRRSDTPSAATRVSLPMRGQRSANRSRPSADRSRPAAVLPAVTTPASTVLLLDTLGELSACWGLADVAFVGGSLTRRGGQNMLEPSAYGAAVVVGPHTDSFRQAMDLLRQGDAIRVLGEAEDLLSVLRELLRHPEEAARLGGAARRVVLSQQGATGRTAELIVGVLGISAGSPQHRRLAEAA